MSRLPEFDELLPLLTGLVPPPTLAATSTSTGPSAFATLAKRSVPALAAPAATRIDTVFISPSLKGFEKKRKPLCARLPWVGDTEARVAPFDAVPLDVKSFWA